MNKKKEEKLRQAARNYVNNNDNKNLGYSEVLAFIYGAKSEAAKEYHTPTVDLTELRKSLSKFKDWCPEKDLDAIFELFLPYIQPKHDKESDAIKFGEYCMSKIYEPLTVQELYHQFQNKQ